MMVGYGFFGLLFEGSGFLNRIRIIKVKYCWLKFGEIGFFYIVLFKKFVKNVVCI